MTCKDKKSQFLSLNALSSKTWLKASNGLTLGLYQLFENPHVAQLQVCLNVGFAPLKFAPHITQFAPQLTKFAYKVDRVRPRCLVQYSPDHGFESRSSLNFFRISFLFATALVPYITAKVFRVLYHSCATTRRKRVKSEHFELGQARNLRGHAHTESNKLC